MLHLLSGAFNSIIAAQVERFVKLGGAAGARALVTAIEERLGLKLPASAYDALAGHLTDLGRELTIGAEELRAMKLEKGPAQRAAVPSKAVTAAEAEELREVGNVFAEIAKAARPE